MSSTQKTERPSPHASETRKFSDRPSSSRAKPSQDDGNNDSDDLDTQKDDSKDDTYNDDDDDDEEGTTTDAENKSENDENGAFAPIKSPAQPNEDNNRLQLSRSIERSWSLNDGYSCHTGDEEAGEKIDEEAKVTGAEEPPEFVVAFDEDDPMNPRNMSTPRRWLVVIICSLGSLCV